MMEIRACKNCGGPFQPIRRLRLKYCNDFCSAEGVKQKNRKHDSGESRKKKKRDRERAKYATDPDYRILKKERSNKYYQKNAVDPKFVARKRVITREYSRKIFAIYRAVKELGLIKTGDLKC